MKAKLIYRLRWKAHSILETMLAMVIISAVFGLGAMFLANSSARIPTLPVAQTQAVVDSLLLADPGPITWGSQEEWNMNRLLIGREVDVWDQDPSMIRLRVYVQTKEGKLLMDRSRLKRREP